MADYLSAIEGAKGGVAFSGRQSRGDRKFLKREWTRDVALIRIPLPEDGNFILLTVK